MTVSCELCKHGESQIDEHPCDHCNGGCAYEEIGTDDIEYEG